ncbi:MAG: AsmA family protein [Candidatus Nitronauta litoralis]|uniref:AsmA family protein n=1 Tax=Candidatus Nitronauta litoralis TaxID=2705533 RepID=A0A7T0FYI8_9BACT|nr:MAG: AsmA family protein [Candidatus Nitronauta litoralis]
MKLDLPAPTDTPEPDNSPGFFKRFVKVIFIFFVVLVVLIFVLIQTVDVNTLREPITKALSDASGLDVNIGSLDLDWSGGMGLRAGEVSVYSQKGKRTLFSSEALFLRVKWAPLLDKQVEVEEAVIQKPVFLIQPQVSSVKPEDSSSRLNQVSALTPRHVGLGPMKRLLMGLHLNAETVRVKNAKILWFPTSDSNAEPLQFHASLVLKVNRPDEKRLDLDVRELDFSSEGFKITGEIAAHNALSPQGHFKANLKGKPLELETLSEFVDFLPPHVKEVWNQFDPSGEIKTWSLKANAEGINLFDESSLKGEKVNAGLTFDVKNLVLQPPADRPELRQGFTFLKGTVNWNNRKLVHELEGEVRDLAFTAKGNLDFSKAPHLQTVIRIPRARADLLNEWLPRDWEIEQGAMSHRVNIRGPLDQPEAFQLDGVVEGERWVVGFKRDTHLKIPMTRIKGGWNFKNETLTIPSLEIAPPNGTIKSKGQYQVSDRTYQLSYQGEGLRVEDFYQQNVDGDLATKGVVSGRIPERGSPLNAVSGDITFAATSGRFHQLEPLRALLTALNPLSVTKLNQKGLSYDSLGGDFKIARGKATTRNLALLSPEMKIYMVGWLDRIINHVEMQGRFQPSQTLDKAVKAVPLLGEILTGGKKGGVLETRFKVSGPLKRPRVTLDAKGTLAGKGGDILRELGRLPGKLAR